MRIIKKLVTLTVIVVLVLSSLLILVSNQVLPVQAAVTWTKSATPVTLEGERYVGDTWVIKNSATDYEMWYTHGKTGLSAVGIVSAITATVPDTIIGAIASLALVQFVGELSSVNVTAMMDLLNGSSTVIGYATSTNGITWTVQDSEVLADSGAAWNSVGAPCVIKDGGTYKMWYTRVKTDLTQASLETILTNLGQAGQRKAALLDLLDSTSTVIGYATSPDGQIWSEINPEVHAGSSGGAWTSVADPCVIKDGTTYKMWYTQGKTDVTQATLDAMSVATFGIDELVDILDGTSTAIDYTTSSGGVAWGTPQEVHAGSDSAWNSVADPSVVTGSSYEMWYTQGNTDLTKADFRTLLNETADMVNDFWDTLEAFSAGDLATVLNNLTALDIATIKGLLDDTNTVIGYASSTTGIDWTVQSSQHLVGSSGSAWSSVAAPSVVKDGDAYKMWYTEGIDNLSVADLLALVLGTDLPIGYASYSPVVPPVPSVPSVPSVDGEWEAPAVEPGITDVSDVVTSEGVFTQDVTAASEDGNVELNIAAGARGYTLDEEGQEVPLSEITVTEMTDPPTLLAETNRIALTYELGPDGAQFPDGITLTLNYDPAALVGGNMVIAYWSGTEWVDLEGPFEINKDNNTISTTIYHFTPFTVLEHISPAAFAASDLAISPTEVDVGQSVTISLLVANTGELSGSYEVTLKIHNVTVDTKYVTLAGGASQKVTFTTTAKDAAGTYTVTVDGLSGTFTVKAPPAPTPAAAFNTSALTISPTEVDIGQSVTISVLVANTGELSGSYEVTLKIDNVTVDTKYVTLAGGASQSVTFTTAKDAAGTYTAAVDGLSGTFTVKAPTVPVKPGPNWWLIGGIIAAVIIIAAIAWLVIRRRTA